MSKHGRKRMRDLIARLDVVIQEIDSIVSELGDSMSDATAVMEGAKLTRYERQNVEDEICWIEKALEGLESLDGATVRHYITKLAGEPQ